MSVLRFRHAKRAKLAPTLALAALGTAHPPCQRPLHRPWCRLRRSDCSLFNNSFWITSIQNRLEQNSLALSRGKIRFNLGLQLFYMNLEVSSQLMHFRPRTHDTASSAHSGVNRVLQMMKWDCAGHRANAFSISRLQTQRFVLGWLNSKQIQAWAGNQAVPAPVDQSGVSLIIPALAQTNVKVISLFFHLQ